MAANLATRAKLVTAMRSAMDAAGFVDVETPTLTRSTPEGARDFLVPSRLSPGTFFALPQSPQLFKQMLMVAGLDRYYQVARCWRDEDLRADRQLEFTQLDVEARFVDQEDVLGFIEEAVATGVEAVTGERPKPFPRLTWAEAMNRFGSDKPDTRFGMELCDLSALFTDSGFNAFKGKGIVGLVVPGQGEMGRNQLDGLVDRAKSLLGTLRLELGVPERIDEPLHFTWVVEFPLFEALSPEGKPIPAHHPFTRPHPDDVDKLESEPLAVRSLAYDLVLNGIELGSGSVRIHDPALQSTIFSLLGIEPDVAAERFGFLLDSFRYGP